MNSDVRAGAIRHAIEKVINDAQSSNSAMSPQRYLLAAAAYQASRAYGNDIAPIFDMFTGRTIGVREDGLDLMLQASLDCIVLKVDIEVE